MTDAWGTLHIEVLDDEMISDIAIASPANGGTATESDKSNQDRYNRLCAEPLAVK